MSTDTPIPVVRLTPATVEDVGGGVLGVNVNGTNPPVWWAAGYIPAAGDAVKVLMVDGTALVHGPVITSARPLTGLAGTAAGDGTVPVTVGGTTYSARYTGAAPVAGSVVRLDWQGTQPWAWPGIAVPVTPPEVPDAPPPKPLPPPVVQSGVTYLTAIDSGTYSLTNATWSSYYGRDVVQGTYGSTTQAGSWFYGSAPLALKGRTVTSARLFLGARLRMGSYNSALSLQLYLHASKTRPAGDVARFGTSLVPLAVAANAPRGWYVIPITTAQALVDNGYGFGIAGGSYGGVSGLGKDAASGQVEITWEK